MVDINNSLVAGLFGLTPQQAWQQQQQQQNTIAQQAFDNASGTPGQLMAQGYANMGTSAVGLGAGMMGIEPDSVVQARQQQAMAQGVDFNDPKSIRERALQIQDPRMKFQYEAHARDVEAKIQAMALQRAQEKQVTAKTALDYAQADKALRENPNLHEVEVGVPGKPDYRQKVIIDKSNPNAQPVIVGSPYQIAAGVRVSMNGAGAEKPMTAQQRVKFENQMSDDYKSTEQVMQTMDNLQKSISDISSSKGLGARTGYTGYLPAWSQGQEAKIAQNRIDTLKGKVTQMGKSMASMSGAIGPMAVQEWKIVSDAVNALDPTADNFSEQLANINDQAIGTAKRIKDVYERQYSDYYSKYPKLDSSNLKVYGAGDAPAQTTGGGWNIRKK